MLKTIYHIENGPAEMYEVDATAAVQNFPKEWSDKPWPEKKAAKTAAGSASTVTYASKDNGDGTFSIVDNSGNVAVKSVTADDAKAFDAMNDTDKAAYVKAEAAAS